MKKLILSIIVLGAVLILSQPVMAQSVSEMQAQIQLLLQQIQELQAKIQQVESQPTQPTFTPLPPATFGEQVKTFSYCFNRDLYFGLENDKDVTALQSALLLENVYNGPVTGNFFTLTRAGVIEFQKKYKFDPIPNTGYVGSFTRKTLNGIYCKSEQSSAESIFKAQIEEPPIVDPVVTLPVEPAAEPILFTALTPETTFLNQNDANVTAGASSFTFTRFILDAIDSTENIHISSISPTLNINFAGIADDLSNCQLRDGTLLLNTGIRTVNPFANDVSGIRKQFVFDNPLIVPAGTSKILNLTCDVDGGATNDGVWQWGIVAEDNAVIATTPTGVSVNDQVVGNSGRRVKLSASGSLSVFLDSSTLPLRLAKAGNFDENLTILGVSAVGEEVRLDTLGLQLGKPNLNSPNDLSRVSIWAGPTKVGETIFTSSDYATATLTGVTIPKDGQIFLTITGDISNIGTGFPARSGHLVAVDYDADSSSDEINFGLTGVGLTSGTTFSAKGLDTQSTGVRLVKATPVVTKLDTAGTYNASANQAIYRFKINTAAGTNGVSLYKFSFHTSSSNSDDQIANLAVRCYSDASLSVPSCGSADGLLNRGTFSVSAPTGVQGGKWWTFFNPVSKSGTAEAIRIPAGATRYFEVRADLSNASGAISTRMLGDAGWQNVSCDSGAEAAGVCHTSLFSTDRRTFTNTASRIQSLSGAQDIIWSDNHHNTTPNVKDYVWMNGFLVPGLSNNDAGTAEVISTTDIPVAKASLSVSSSPTGASVTNINTGQVYCASTPCTVSVPVPPNSINIRVSKDGYSDWTNLVFLTAGQTTNVQANLPLIPVVTTQVTITSPNGGETFIQGNLNEISWSGGKDKVQIGLVKHDFTNNNPVVLGWISLAETPNGSLTWDGKEVCDLTGTVCWDVHSLHSGPYKIIAVSADSVGNYCIYSASGGCNSDVSDSAFDIIALFLGPPLQAINDTDLYISSATKSNSLFYVTVCMSGSKTINDLKSDITNLYFYPVGYSFVGSNGVTYNGTSNVGGATETIKNGQCASYFTSLWSSHSAYFTGAQNVTFTADQDNLIEESNEANNEFTWIPGSASNTDLSTNKNMANVLSNLQALLDEIAKAISAL